MLTLIHSSRTLSPGTNPLGSWSAIISSSLTTLRQLAGATEREILQIGTQMQGIHQRATTLSQAAHQLVEVASGERIHTLIDQLRQVLHEMETYLGQTQVQSTLYCTALNTVDRLLMRVSEPLGGFKKMSKRLQTLERLIKIESAYLGEMGGEFINLALDIKKLSQQIKEKSYPINDHRLLLMSMISKNIIGINAAKSTQETKVRSTLDNTATSIGELESANKRFSQLGSMVSTISSENSENISEVVQSMQFHDIFRQQVEHIIEALEELTPSLSAFPRDVRTQDVVNIQGAISEAGDVCELQESQLQFASAEFYTAVVSIISNLRDIGGKQKLMAQEIYAQSGIIDTSGSSFIDDVGNHMSSTTDIMTTCASMNNKLVAIMKELTAKVDEITGFVSDIEDIGHDIVQITLNARIKAACIGPKGASLCVLADEIGQLSSDDVQRVDTIIAALTEIHATTGVLTAEANCSEVNLSTKIIDMKANLNNIMAMLEGMGTELFSLLAQVHNQVNALTEEIERITGSINVHERTKTMADEVLDNFRRISSVSRALYPASAAFKENLHRVAERYTMESERRIHEDIAGKHGVRSSMSQMQISTNSKSNDSEFGDNVDLF